MVPLKATLTKVIFETNNQTEFDKVDDEDRMYMISQINADNDKDVDMEGVEKMDDFEFLDFDLSNLNDSWVEPPLEKDKRENDDDSGEEEDPEERRKRLNPMGLGFTDEAADHDDDEYENSQQLQAFTYDRSFVASGSVVKVYEPVDELDNERKNALKHSFTIDKIKNENGETVHPVNMMLHDSENRLIFSDAHDTSQIFNFDLETGKVVEQFQAAEDEQYSKLNHLTSTIRNGQTSTEPLLVGVGDRSIFTMDTRLNTKIKKAQEKLYKTNPMFS